MLKQIARFTQINVLLISILVNAALSPVSATEPVPIIQLTSITTTSDTYLVGSAVVLNLNLQVAEGSRYSGIISAWVCEVGVNPCVEKSIKANLVENQPAGQFSLNVSRSTLVVGTWSLRKVVLSDAFGEDYPGDLQYIEGVSSPLIQGITHSSIPGANLNISFSIVSSLPLPPTEEPVVVVPPTEEPVVVVPPVVVSQPVVRITETKLEVTPEAEVLLDKKQAVQVPTQSWVPAVIRLSKVALGGQVSAIKGSGSQLQRWVDDGSGTLVFERSTQGAIVQIYLGDELIGEHSLFGNRSRTVFSWNRPVFRSKQVLTIKTLAGPKGSSVRLDAIEINGRLLLNPKFMMQIGSIKD